MIPAPATTKPADVPSVHPCGRCQELARYADQSPSGAVLYLCHACGDHKGHPTLVQMGRFAPAEKTA